jgi:hypothetical protein
MFPFPRRLCRPLYCGLFTHGNTPLNIGVSTIFPFTLVS